MPNVFASFPAVARWGWLVVPLALVFTGACAEADGNTPEAAAEDPSRIAQPVLPGKIQSVTLDARRQPGPAVMAELRDLGATHVTLIQFGFQRGYNDPEIRMHTDADWFSESDRGIRHLAREADSLGLGIILKPHIWIGRYSADGQSRDAIGFETEAEWAKWEANYRTLLMHYAHLAEEIGAAMLVIGTELTNVARTRPHFWRGLAREVRGVYGGALTYAANWYEDYEHVTFWDALDYIGVQAYFELSQEDAPTEAMLLEGWTPHKETLRRLAEETGRPVLFTEIGYRNVPFAAAQPWRWPARSDAGTIPPDDALQARLYEVFFQGFWHEPWFAGAILWKWHPDASRRRNRLDFTPQGKPAEAVIARWFRQGRAASTAR